MFDWLKGKGVEQVPPIAFESPPERRVNDDGLTEEKRILPGLGEVWVSLPHEDEI